MYREAKIRIILHGRGAEECYTINGNVASTMQ
jgi:hypothetical protein